jgi:hypothetical protein
MCKKQTSNYLPEIFAVYLEVTLEGIFFIKEKGEHLVSHNATQVSPLNF